MPTEIVQHVATTTGFRTVTVPDPPTITRPGPENVVVTRVWPQMATGTITFTSVYPDQVPPWPQHVQRREDHTEEEESPEEHEEVGYVEATGAVTPVGPNSGVNRGWVGLDDDEEGGLPKVIGTAPPADYTGHPADTTHTISALHTMALDFKNMGARQQFSIAKLGCLVVTAAMLLAL